MKILFDQGTPAPLRRELAGHDVTTAFEMDWAGFMEYISSLKDCRYLFRGQNQPWRLRTSYHRNGRADLGRFLEKTFLLCTNTSAPEQSTSLI